MFYNVATFSRLKITAAVQRTNLTIPLRDALASVARHFEVGRVSSWHIMTTGYQDLNVRFSTDRGSFLAKFFSKDRSLTRITDVVKTMAACYKAGVPVQRLLESNDGPVFGIPGSIGTTYVSVLEYFDGDDFCRSSPTKDDFLCLARAIALMHNAKLRIGRFYDDWGAANVFEEFPKTASLLDNDSLRLVEKTKEELETIKGNNFQKCTIHGDFYRSHVLRSTEGTYCIIDFGCVDFNWAILDLAIFLAWFCFDELSSFDTMQEIYTLVLNEYMESRNLTQAEISAIPILIRATYAAYQMASARLLAQGDNSEQTKDWYHKSLFELKKSQFLARLTF